jgi:dolichol-phosphate mannosyltransferase
MPSTSLRSATTALPHEWAATPLTVVMPTYNEADSLPATAHEVLELPLPGLQLKVVDDNSPDGTGDLAEEIAERANSRVQGPRPRMTVLRRAGKEGLGRAYAEGMAQAAAEGARYVVQMDADGSHPAEAVPRMLGTALANGCGLVVGSRYVSGGSLGEEWGAHRRLLSAWANRYAAAVLGLRGLRDITAGFNLWRADALEDIGLTRLTSAGYSFQVEAKYAALRAGHTAVEVPIRFTDRTAGTSKMTLAVQLESATLPWRLRFTRTPR